MKNKSLLSLFFIGLLTTCCIYARTTGSGNQSTMDQNNTEITETPFTAKNNKNEDNMSPSSHQEGPNKTKYSMGRKYMMKLRKNNPVEFQRLMKLRVRDPNKFGNELRLNIHCNMQRSEHGKYRKHNKQFSKLIGEYKNAKTPEEQWKIKIALKILIEKNFVEKQTERDQFVQKLKAKLDKLQKKLDNHNNNKQQIIELKLNQLLTEKQNTKES